MSEKIIRVQDLVPENSSFHLSLMGRNFSLRPCTVGLLVSMNRTIGNIEQMLASPDAENLSKMAMFLMEFESASSFKKQKVKIIDALSGEEREDDVGGYFLLMSQINGVNEQMNIYKAILKSLGYGEERSSKLVEMFFGEVNEKINEIAQDLKKKMS